AGLHDAWPTPLGEVVPGVLAHAQAAEQILSQAFLYRPDWAHGAEGTISIVLGALLTGLLLWLGARYASAILIAIIAIGLARSLFALTQCGMLSAPVCPLLSVSSSYFAVVGVLFVATEREKKFVRQAFGQYVAPELLSKLEAAPDLMRLGGETRVIT